MLIKKIFTGIKIETLIQGFAVVFFFFVKNISRIHSLFSNLAFEF